MMNNLFSIFDTSTSMLFNLNWISSLINILILPPSFWLFPSYGLMWIWSLIKKLYNELKNILADKFNFLNSIFFICLFMNIFLNNMSGLFPYIFTSSSHLIFSLSISLSLWIGCIIFCLFNNINFMFSHMIPQGTPILLMPFMVIIETISNLIRPSTLAIRLTANMIAGHLLLTLLSNSILNNYMLITFILIFIMILLLILEFSVSIIQSYVFMILSTLYFKETN